MGGIDPLKPNVTLPSNKVPNDKGTPEETTPKPAKEPKTIPPPTLDEKKPGDSNYDKYVTQQIGLAEANQGNGSETLRALEIKKCMEGTPKFKAEAKLKEKLIYDLLELGFTSDQIIKLLSSLASPDDFNNRIICLLLPKSAKAMLDKGNSTEDTIDYLEKSQKQIERSQPKLLIQSGLSLKEIDSLIINVSKMVDEENIWFAIDILPELIDHGLTADDISLLLKDCITACNGNTVNSMFSCITGLLNIGLDKKDVIEIIRITYENTEGNPASSSPVYISHSTFILNLKSAFLSLFQGTKSITELPLKDQDAATLQSIISIYKSHGGKAGHGTYVLIPELIKARYNIDDIIPLIELIKAKSGKQADLFYIELAGRIKSGEQIESILQEYHSLWDLNITWINRFSKEARAEIISNRQNREPDGRPLAVVFLPKADHNGAFTTDVGIYDELIAKGYRVMVYEEPTDKEEWAALKQATSKQKASLIIWAGHGNKGSIQTGDGYTESNFLDIEDEPEMMELNLGDSLIEGGTVLCFSCSTGKGEEREDNIANMLARVFPKASHIWAPTKDTTIEKLIYDEDNNVTGIIYGEDIDYDAIASAEQREKLLKEIAKSNSKQDSDIKIDNEVIQKRLIEERFKDRNPK